jgi:hypothetical protein
MRRRRLTRLAALATRCSVGNTNETATAAGCENVREMN